MPGDLMNSVRIVIAVVICIQLQTIVASAQSPLKLWYKQPATKWTEALSIGNGRIGAMIFGGTEKERVQFNEETLWTGSPRSYNRTGAYKYLDTIRQLLFAGKQKEAEAIAEAQFMGLRSAEGDKNAWVTKVKENIAGIGNPAQEKFDDSQWKTMTVPSYEGWEAVGFDGLDGAVWLRTYFDLPADWAGKNIILDLNRIRDHDLTYVNGALVGSMENADPRKYSIAKEHLHTGKNSLAILVFNYTDKGGVAGYKDTSRHIGIYPEGQNEGLKISLNGLWKYFIQNDEPPATPRYQADYQPFGDLWMNFKHGAAVSNYRRELDISNAIAAVSYTVNAIDYQRTYFVSEPNQSVVIHLAASKANSISLDLSLSSPHKNSLLKKINDSTIALNLQVRNGALRGESRLQVRITNGTMLVEADRIVISNANEATILLTAGTNFINYHDVSGDPATACIAALKSAADKSYSVLRSVHIAEYQSYFNTMSVDFGSGASDALTTDQRIEKFANSSDPAFVALYLQYGRYLLTSSSRPGTQPANLQGIWNDQLSPPWGSKYTTNINLEMNYWPSDILNLSAMQEPLFKMADELAMTGQQTAKEYYNAPGWVLHHNTDLWRGTAPINAANHGIWVTGAAWLCHHLWEHYLYTRDKIFLKTKAYPLMKAAASFFNNFLILDPVNGWWISTPSNSPEQGGLVAGPTMDHQLIRDLFSNTITASNLLKTDKKFRDSLEKKLPRIAPNQAGKYGQLQEWLTDIDDTTNKHRHVSHLWGVYPGSEINWDDTPGMMKAARQSLLYRGDAATGWSLGWKINFWARFKDGDHAYKLMQLLLSPASAGAGSYPNLLDAHPPFQIDGNFGGAAGIGEMLLQSHTNYIDLLPALPSALAAGSIRGICARGGFVFDMIWSSGKLDRVEMISNAGRVCKLRYNDRVIQFATKKGARYIFNGKLEKVK